MFDIVLRLSCKIGNLSCTVLATSKSFHSIKTNNFTLQNYTKHSQLKVADQVILDHLHRKI